MPNDPRVDNYLRALVNAFTRETRYPQRYPADGYITLTSPTAERVIGTTQIVNGHEVLALNNDYRWVVRTGTGWVVDAEPARTPPDGFRFCAECGDEVEASTVFCECELNPF